MARKVLDALLGAVALSNVAADAAAAREVAGRAEYRLTADRMACLKYNERSPNRNISALKKRTILNSEKNK